MQENRISNKDVIVMLKEILAAMEVKGFNSFRVRAYQNAISVLENLTVSIQDLWENKRLGEIPGIGPGIEAHLNELMSLKKLKKPFPKVCFLSLVFVELAQKEPIN